MSATTPFFITEKEINLIDHLNEELIDEIVGQSVDIYKVNTTHTKDNIYGESTTKYFNVGFRVNCLVRFNAPEVEQFNEIFDLQKKRIYNALLNSSSEEVINFDNVLSKIING